MFLFYFIHSFLQQQQLTSTITTTAATTRATTTTTIVSTGIINDKIPRARAISWPSYTNTNLTQPHSIQ